MPTRTQKACLRNAYLCAREAGHIFPAAAACEAALESAWFSSELFLRANNVFGERQHQRPVFETVTMPTREFVAGRWVVDPEAKWIKFPRLVDAFRSRMETLCRLEGQYPHYRAALRAGTPEEFLREVSQTWSTGPDRARVALAILEANAECFA